MSYKDTYITKKSHPKEWALITKAFPHYRKRKAVLVETESTSLTGRYWDDGSISRYAIITMPIGTVLQKANRNDFPFTAADTEVDLTDGTQVVQCGIFCGKQGLAYLYRRSSNYTCPTCGESFPKDAEFALMEYCPECGRATGDN